MHGNNSCATLITPLQVQEPNLGSDIEACRYLNGIDDLFLLIKDMETRWQRAQPQLLRVVRCMAQHDDADNSCRERSIHLVWLGNDDDIIRRSCIGSSLGRTVQAWK